MTRLGSMLGVSVLVLVSGVVHAAVLSPDATFIRDREYQVLNTDDSIGPLDANAFPSTWKANGTLPSIGSGLVVWEDGRSGKQSVMGFVLASPGEFLISDANDVWQEGNPFAGYNAAGGYVWTVYDAGDVEGATDHGDIQGSAIPPSPDWLVQESMRQQSPVFTNYDGGEFPVTDLIWLHDPLTSGLNGLPNIDIYKAGVPGGVLPSPLAGALDHITVGNAAPRDNLAADGRYITWQEFREDAATLNTSWDIVVYDLIDANFRYIDGPVGGPTGLKDLIDPDISGDLVVFTQVDDPTEASKTTNIHFLDLSDPNSVSVAVTTSGTADRAAISRHDGNYFVVWQERGAGESDFTGNETDFNWDIWGQEITLDGFDWVLHDGGPFLIRSDVGRQYFPDIDGLDVVWQSQDPDVGEVYVWGPVPEPCTAIAFGLVAPFLLAARRKRRLEKK